ncbi:MAG: hypothetical protein ACLSHW_00855 [Lachnospiraceae bacterium]
MYRKGMEQIMEKKTVDVIIPAYRPGEGWKQTAARTGRTDLAGTPPDRDEYRRGKLGSGL